MSAKLNEQEQAAADLKDKYLRALADMENLRERSKRDVKDANNFAVHKFAKDLLEFADNLDVSFLILTRSATNSYSCGDFCCLV